MKSKTLWRLLALLTALGLVAAACGSDSDSTEAGDSADSSADEQPGAGISVTQARANWSTSYMQAAIYNQLMTELGYEMNDPSGSEVDPATFFPALAEGDFDFWTESWQPLYDFQYIDTNESIMNNVTTVGMQMEAGGLQGIMIDIKTADELGITHIDQIAETQRTPRKTSTVTPPSGSRRTGRVPEPESACRAHRARFRRAIRPVGDGSRQRWPESSRGDRRSRRNRPGSPCWPPNRC